MRRSGLAVAAVLALLVAVVVGVALYDPGPSSEATPGAAEGAPAERAVEEAEAPVGERSAGAPKETAEARERVPEVPDLAGRVRLRLVRWPDGRPLARTAVEWTPLGVEADAEPVTDFTDARAELAAPDAPRVRVRVRGFAPEEADVIAPLVEVELRPTSGLFGRVTRADGSPVVGATMRLRKPDQRMQSYGYGGQFLIQDAFTIVGRGETGEDGWYFMEAPAELDDRVEITAYDGSLSATRTLALPREPEPIEDLVLAPAAEGLLLRIVKETGEPLADAAVRGWKNGIHTTDAQGECRIPDPQLPDRFFTQVPGLTTGRMRVDGIELSRLAEVPPGAREVELVLQPIPWAHVRVLDRATRRPVHLVNGSLDLFDASGARAGYAEFAVDADGVGQTNLHTDREEPVDIRTVSLRVSSRVHEQYGPVELDLAAVTGDEPFEVLLDAYPGSVTVRGRVTRSGEPAAALQVGVVGLVPQPDGSFVRWSGTRVMTDDDGRFAAHWVPRETNEKVAVYPHWFVYDEFGSVGPLSIAEATSRELHLEIEPGLRVPARILGAQKGGRYALYVSSVRGEGQVPITINGASIAAGEVVDGALETTVTVPSNWPSRLTVGYRTRDRVFAESSAPVFFDPERRELPLVFELNRAYGSIAGRVVGNPPSDPGALRILAVRSGSDDRHAVVATPEPDGSFLLDAVPLGSYDVVAILAGDGWQKPLGKEPVEVDGAVTGVLLHADEAAATER